jgi:mono/diheme cytochrome c family protein
MEVVMRGLVFLLALLLPPLTLPASAATQEGQFVRGSYLVNQVAMCVQCHTPRDSAGVLDRTQLLKGAPIPVRSPFPTQGWAFAAPAIAGLAGWTNEGAITLLTTGRRIDASAPRPPMPPFRLTREDAEAVVAYLRALR